MIHICWQYSVSADIANDDLNNSGWARGCGGWTVEDCWAGNEHLTVSVCLLLTALCTDTALWAICCSLCTVMCSAKSFPNVNQPRDKKVQMNGRKGQETGTK